MLPQASYLVVRSMGGMEREGERGKGKWEGRGIGPLFPTLSPCLSLYIIMEQTLCQHCLCSAKSAKLQKQMCVKLRPSA